MAFTLADFAPLGAGLTAGYQRQQQLNAYNQAQSVRTKAIAQEAQNKTDQANALITLKQLMAQQAADRATATLDETTRHNKATEGAAAAPKPAPLPTLKDVADLEDKTVTTAGNLPRNEQPGYIKLKNQSLTQAGAPPIDVPGSVIGQRPTNFGLDPSGVQTLQQALADPNKDPQATGGQGPSAVFTSPSLGTKPLSAYRNAPPVDVTAPYFGPDVKTQGTLDHQANQDKFVALNYGLKQSNFKSEADYRTAQTKATNRRLDLQAQGMSSLDAQRQVQNEIAQGKLTLGVDTLQQTVRHQAVTEAAPGKGGGNTTAQYNRAMARMTALTTAPDMVTPPKLTFDAKGNPLGAPAAIAEYKALKRQTQGGNAAPSGNAAPQGGLAPMPVRSVVPGIGRVQVPPAGLGALPSKYLTLKQVAPRAASTGLNVPNPYLKMTRQQRINLARQRGLMK